MYIIYIYILYNYIMACIAFVGSLSAHLIKFCPLPLFLSWALALTILLRSSALLHKSAAVNFDDFVFLFAQFDS